MNEIGYNTSPGDLVGCDGISVIRLAGARVTKKRKTKKSCFCAIWHKNGNGAYLREITNFFLDSSFNDILS
jgi:hypothetical protein